MAADRKRSRAPWRARPLTPSSLTAFDSLPLSVEHCVSCDSDGFKMRAPLLKINGLVLYKYSMDVVYALAQIPMNEFTRINHQQNLATHENYPFGGFVEI